ncbi:hypothetical protein SDC9_22931 [bioreactor metagenome]|uniref:Protease PrsW n=1 Tax=bioreactor metagenome TaxID=1076179 RepID=A0A644UDY9_9ZZZZ|nr:hypothetical protein [Negativicutes bacterium]
MAYIIACLMASLSFLLNRMLLKCIGNLTIITLSPVVEEMAKTLLSFYLGADVLATHIVFGLLEAVYDWQGSQNKLKAAALSIIGHSLFGLVTVGVFYLSVNIWLGLAVGIVTHLIWNFAVLQVFSRG